MRSLELAGLMGCDNFTLTHGERELYLNVVNSMGISHLEGEFVVNENQLGRHENILNESPTYSDNSGYSENSSSPNKVIEVNDDVSSEENYPVCVTCVTPTLSNVSALSDLSFESDNTYKSKERDNTFDDVIIDLEGQKID